MNDFSECFLITTCAAGLESLTTGEIDDCGGRVVQQARGRIEWCGDMASAYRMCLWSRFASRVFLKISEFDADDADALYAGALGIDWQRHMDVKSTFAVDCTLSRSLIAHSRFAALRVKDAVADWFREKTGARPSVRVDRPDVKIRLHVHENRAVIAVDLSGESLHRRGYRLAGGGEAPLKESLAAAIVMLAGWTSDASPESAFLDPMCGSGTLLIEAALVYGDSAPGLSRTYFGFTGWKGHNIDLWSHIVNQAIEREEAGLNRPWPRIIGYDADPRIVAVARQNIESAGLSDRIVVKQKQLAFLKSPSARGLLVCNPPYGERLLEVEEALRLYQSIGFILKKEFQGWDAGVFMSNPDMGHRVGVKWQSGHRLLNGPITCRLFCGEIKEEAGSDFQWRIMPAGYDSVESAFSNRLRKNLKKFLKWAGRSDISCFRIYDRDIPEYNVTVDIYEKRVLVQEYAPPANVDVDAAALRFSQVLADVRHVLDINRDRVFIKTRRRQKGKSQYQKQAASGRMFMVREGPCRFLVNFTDYLDTGLFLDHRATRRRIGGMAAGKRFLNLYGYTGTATVHAAAGRAESTITVDLSANYLAWCRMNLCLNGFGGLAHETVKADCMEWLGLADSEYDLIFMDPPTFTNTRKKGRVFNVQQDHQRLIELAMKRLAPGGVLIFSCNFSRFRLDGKVGQRFNVRNISRKTIPFDFERNSRVHQCWELRKD